MALIHQIPRDLMTKERKAERLDWLRSQVAESEAKRAAFSLDDLDVSDLLDGDKDEVQL